MEDLRQLSIVIPVFNEQENLELLCEKVKQALSAMDLEDWEVILVNDGSRDNSEAVMEAIATADARFKPIHFVANQGQTAAMDAGIRHVRFAFFATMDADLQNDPADLRLLKPAMADGIGAVCGVRVQRRDTFIRRISSKIANWVRNKLSNETITDTGCSLKLFRTQAFERIKLYEGMHRFLPTLIKLEGYSVVEVPVGHHPRHAGESKYGVWNRVFKSFTDLLAVRWMKKRYLRYQIKTRQESTEK
ncbi:MAG: glycosyltransferase family 2 protein [Acidobacteria bacterium]|nr:glycosyltransferase family 2 protein [Acidobacteriota bacterium]